MESLITKQKIDLPEENTPVESTTKTEPPQYVKEFMNFMADLPSVYKQFIPGEETSSEEKLTPLRSSSHSVKKLNTQDPVVQQIVSSIQNSSLEDEDKDYLLTLGNRESGLNPNAKQGSFKGLYQFNKDSLRTVGIPEKDYDEDLTKQFEAALRYKAINLKALSKYKDLIGTVFKGVTVTANGMAAAAHLLGAGAVMDFFDGTTHSDRAKKGFKDALGTSIEDYFRLFA